MTEEGIASAKARSSVPSARTSLGHNLTDLGWLTDTVGLVTSNDVVRDPKFPIRDLASVAPQLRWIHIIGAGVEPLLPLDWLPRDVILTNNSGVHVEKTRESAMMALLMLNARLPTIATNQRNRHWDQIFTPLIAGRTALVIGVGDMGTAVARAAKELGLRVVGVRRTRGSAHPQVDAMISVDALDLALPKADFVILTTPLTPETRNLLDRRRIALMKTGAGIFNIGRAACVDHDALAEALRSGALSGAVLDVHDPEPLPASSPLWHIDNLLIIPHVTSDDLDSYLPKTFDLVFSNWARLIRGEPLLNVVDRVRGY
ncbi:MAG TPA: D-2-hydroxyacid dehydrogenase [Stellaceae bacterium]|nr:D-2-hydroxyacid dehydrogenase [Stellaceae bacterium]